MLYCLLYISLDWNYSFYTCAIHACISIADLGPTHYMQSALSCSELVEPGKIIA